MFDFSNQDKKEKYYKRGEAFLMENELTCFTVDRNSFGVMQNIYARINLEPFSRKTVTKEELLRAKQTKPFVTVNDRFTRRNPMNASSLRENAYLVFELDEEDR